MSHTVYLLGLGAIFLSLLAAVGGLALRPSRHAQVQETLSLAKQMGIGRNLAVPPHLLPARERLLAPVTLKAARVARRMSGQGAVASLQGRLDKAGNPRGWTVERVLASKGLGLFGGALLGLLVGHSRPVLAVVLVAVLGAFGFFLPDILLANVGTKRQLVVERTLSDAMDLLVISVSAGLGFDQSLSHVARKTTGPLAGEFARVLQEIQIGKSRAAALRGLATRTGSASVTTFVQSVIQADELGVPIARVLAEQAKEMRIRRRQLAEEKAQKVPVKIVFPIVLFIMPVLMIITLGPGILATLHVFHHGN